MDKNMERRLREHYAREARHRWVAFPQALICTMEDIIKIQSYTPGERVEMMKWAMEAYNDALKEAFSNAETV